MTADLAGKVAIVTGGASGMGAATARRFSELGATVVVVDRDEAGARAIADELGSSPPLTGDISEPSFCDAAVQETLARHDRLDILVNAAGVIVRSPAHETPNDQWRRIFAVNVDGLFYMSRAAVGPMLAAGGGSIVNFGSVWGSVGSAGHAAYAATKGAVHQLTKSMALELARSGIRVNAVCPGEIRTPMLLSGRVAPPTEDDLRRLADETIPMGRLGEPDEVAAVVSFLASDAASYITGSLVAVDAGYVAQ